MPVSVPADWELPKLRTSFVFADDVRYLLDPDKPEHVVSEFFDVKFCPYQPLDKDPIFAAVSQKHIVVCRLLSSPEAHNPCEVISLIRDDDKEAVNDCGTWTQDAETGRPLFCVGGEDAKIKVYDVIEGRVVACLPGHGSDINDLTTSPANPQIIASCSNDTTVRVWSLSPTHQEQPCICVLGGEAHTWILLAVAFHDSGRYLLSSGHDQIVNLWTLPDIPDSPLATPTQVFYPHFSTSEIHSGIVDSLAFYGDNILSRGYNDETIVMWRIEGFSSADPPPPPELAPTTYNPKRLTRSSFSPPYVTGGPRQFTRLVTFSTPGCDHQFYMRFKLFFVPGKHPVLAFSTTSRKIFFWDFERLLGYHEYKKALERSENSNTTPPQRPSWLNPVNKKGSKADAAGRPKSRAADRETEREDSEATSDRPIGMSAYSDETIQTWEERYSTADPHEALKAHRVETVGTTSSFVGRQVAWSPGGEWCVVVGSNNVCWILERWRNSRKA